MSDKLSLTGNPGAIEAAARELHRFNAPRVANDVEPWSAVMPAQQARWLKQAELALLAAEGAAGQAVPVVEQRGG